MTAILVIEDDIDISQGIAEYLSVKGYELDFAYNGRQALHLIESNHYDLILLDLNLPYVDGLDVCRSLLTEHLTAVPVIIMSARSKETDILKGFDSGAWDYLAKPFSFAELSARIAVCLAKAAHAHQKLSVIERAGVTLTLDDMTLSVAGHCTQLHQVSFEFVKLLMEQYPSAVKTSAIHRSLWGEETPDSDPLRAHVYKMRKQFKSEFGQEFITTVRGVGYKFDIDESAIG
ncbi:response regulator transcription factor [Thalassotalea montiporae]